MILAGQTKTSLGNIQALRALAATLVVFVHLDIVLATLGLPAFGAGGVDLFFIISGFIMVYTTEGRQIGGGMFLRNRIARIVPMYYVLTLAVFAVASIAPRLLNSTTANPFDLLKSLLFIPYRKGSGLILPVLFVGWTLNFEMMFYVLFSVGLTFRNYLLGIAFTIGVLTILTLFGLIWPPHEVIAYFYTQSFVFEFAIGMAIALWFRRGMVLQARLWSFLLPLIICVGLAVLVILPLPPNREGLLTTGLPAAAIVWAALAMEKRHASVGNAVVLAIGDASYSMYLTHPFVTQTFQKIAQRLHVSGALSVVMIVLCLLAIFIVAQAVHRLVEEPLTQIARRLLKAGKLNRPVYI